MSETNKTQRLGAFFQLGYVCRDLKGAMKSFGERRGVVEWAEMEGPMLNYGRMAPIKIALAYSGPAMVELIQAPSDIPTIYTSAIPSDPLSARLHHIGYIVEDEDEWDAIQAQVAQNGTPIVAGAEMEAIRYCYADTRADTGHFTEYCLPRAEMTAFWNSLPRNP